MQVLALGHETPVRTACAAPRGLGIDSGRHRFPFHRSAKGTSGPEPLTWSPTAMQTLTLGHETPPNWTSGTPRAGLGVDSIPHRGALADARPRAGTANATGTTAPINTAY